MKFLEYGADNKLGKADAIRKMWLKEIN